MNPSRKNLLIYQFSLNFSQKDIANLKNEIEKRQKDAPEITDTTEKSIESSDSAKQTIVES